MGLIRAVAGIAKFGISDAPGRIRLRRAGTGDPGKDYDAQRQLRFAHDLISHAYRANARLA
jgi:hypothetical protein